MTCIASRNGAGPARTFAFAVFLATASTASAAPTVGDSRVVLDTSATLDPVVTNEALVGNGTDLFGAFVQTLPSGRTLLRGTFFNDDGAMVTPELQSGTLVSGNDPRDGTPAAASTRPTLAMNARGSVLGAYANDVFRIGRDYGIASLPLGAHGVPAAALFPVVGGAQAAVLVGDAGADATGTFLFAACTPNACTVQLIGDNGALLGGELPLFAFPSADPAGTPAMIAAVYVPSQGFRVVAAQGQEVYASLVTAAAVATPVALADALSPECEGWVASSVRVGRGATPASAQARITTTCTAATATWIALESLAPRTESLCTGAAGVNDCAFISSDSGLFVAQGNAIFSVDGPSPTYSRPEWVAPLRAAPARGSALAIAANVPAIAHVVPLVSITPGSTPWRPLTENTNLYTFEGSATASANGADFRGAFVRGSTGNVLLRGDSELVPFPMAAASAAVVGVAETSAARTFAATTGQLVLFDAGSGASSPFGGLLALGRAGESVLALGIQYGAVTPLLYAYTLDPDTFGAPTGGALGLGAVVRDAHLLGATDSSIAELAFDGTSYLVVFTRGDHLDGVLVAANGVPTGAPFPISNALYRQSQPQVAALPGGGFFVAWTDARSSLAQSDIFGTYVGADGSVASPVGIAIARTAADEVQPFIAMSPDPDHLVVVWSEFLTSSPRSWIRTRGAAVSRSQARARAAFSIEAGPGDHIAVGALSAAQVGVTALYEERGAPAGGARILARSINLGNASGQACTADAECITDACVKGLCSEPPAAPGAACDEQCAVLDPASNVCVAAPRGSVPLGAGCPGYLCNGSSLGCPSTCQTSADCSSDAECEDKTCVVVRSCTSDTELSDRGVIKSCGAYKCDALRALCFEQCSSTTECAAGLVCDENGGCVAPPPAAEGGCTVSNARLSAGNAPFYALALFAMVMLRRRRTAAALAAVVGLGPALAHAADARVGASVPLPTVAGTTFAPVVGLDASATALLGLPGAEPQTLYRFADRAGAWRDGVVGDAGVLGWSAAAGPLGRSVNCADGSVLAIERVTTAKRSATWLLHYTQGALPTHRIRVPDTTAAPVTCTSDGAWVALAELTDAYERYVWTSAAAAQHVRVPYTGTHAFFSEASGGYVVIADGGSRFVFGNIDGSAPQSVTTFPNPPATAFSVGTRAVVSYATFDGDSFTNWVASVGIENGALAYTQAPAPLLPAPTPGTLAPRAAGRGFTYRSGALLHDYTFPPGDAPPVHLTSLPVIPLGGASVGYARGPNYELAFEDGSRRAFALADLGEAGGAGTRSALATATPRALRLATSRAGITRMLGYQGGALTLFRTDSAPRAVSLPPELAGHTPADLQSLADGSASMITREGNTSAGHLLAVDTDARSPFPLLDTSTSTASLGDGVAAIHFVSMGARSEFSFRHLSATVGETSRSVSVPSPGFEWGLRDVTAVAAVGNEGFAAFVRGTGGGEQHLDWARIKQGTVSEPLPLVRAFALQVNPKIACDPSGVRGCLVAWEDYRKNDYDADLYVARILPDGTTPDGDGILVAGTAHGETEPTLIWSDDDDHFFVAWRDSLLGEERKAGLDPSLIKGAFVRHDGTVEDPGGFQLSDEPLDEMAPILFAAERGTFQLAYQVFVGAADISSNQITLRTLRAGTLRGEACSTDGECAGRACIDGICCEASCRDGCGTCSQPGKLGLCVARGDGEESYQQRCGSYRCDGASTSCPVTCRDTSDCTTEATCDPNTRQCSGAEGTTCADDLTVETEAGGKSSCLPYRCLRGQCASRCESNAECGPGNVCTPERRCEPAPPAAEGGCSASASSPWSAGVVGMAVLALLARKRKRAH